MKEHTPYFGSEACITETAISYTKNELCKAWNEIIEDMIQQIATQENLDYRNPDVLNRIRTRIMTNKTLLKEAQRELKDYLTLK